MNRPRLIKGLKIGWTAFWSVVAVLLIVLWVRSYWWMDQVYGHIAPTKVLHFGSMGGQLTFRYLKRYNGTGLLNNWIPEAVSVAHLNRPRRGLAPKRDLYVYRYESRFNFGWTGSGFYVPHWTPSLLAALLAPAVWFRCANRFSLRTLLIFTTLVAIVLGLIVWAR